MPALCVCWEKMAKNAKNEIAQINVIGEKQAEKMGYELLEAVFEKESTGVYLRFYLDKEGGITLDDCESYHRAVQPMVERFEYDFMEVCSPGIDRPIKNERDAQRCLGLDIEVRLYKPVDGRKVYEGILIGLEDKEVVILCGEEQKRFPQKTVALVKPIVDMTGVESVEFD